MESEKKLQDQDLIVSSTDAKGIINYVNSTFCEISEYTQKELYGQAHNIIRHPDMPQAIFKFIWKQLQEHKPLVAYVKNYTKCKTKYYWVKAVMYPKVIDNTISKISSYRTKATDFEIEQIEKLYQVLVTYEKNHSVDESYNYFLELLREKNLNYDTLINRLNDKQQILNTTLLNIGVQKYRTAHMILLCRIESLVEKGYKNIDITSEEFCEFQEKISTLLHGEFVHNPKLLEIQKLHEKIAQDLQFFVDNSNETQRKAFVPTIYKAIDNLFNKMENFKNTHCSSHEQY